MIGNPDVEKYMGPVAEAISRHIHKENRAWTDIYNRCYEAVSQAINGAHIELAQANKMSKCTCWRYDHSEFAGGWVCPIHGLRTKDFRGPK